MFHIIQNDRFQVHLERHIDACIRELQLESGESQRFANHLKERFCKDPTNLDVLGGFCHQLRAVRTASFSTDMDLKTVESTLSQIRRRRARGTSGLWPSSP